MTNNNWYKSKTKWAGILVGVSLALPSIIGYLNGSGLDITGIWQGIVAILGVFGLRDALDLNKYD